VQVSGVAAVKRFTLPVPISSSCHRPKRSGGLIHYQRGKITVLDRPGLEARSCECYQVVKAEFDRLLPYVAR
jgi:hypothetical protein